jgi:acyl-CoA synthetase (AMP-forming)/AMP-acid ligase II
MFEKIRFALTKNLTMANLQERLAEVYDEEVETIRLEEPLQYHSLNGDRLNQRMGREFINRVCHSLTGPLGVKPGETVAVCTSNNIDLYMILTAVMRIGAVAVPLNYMLKGREIRYIVENSGARTMITDAYVFDGNIREKARVPSITQWVMAGPEAESREGFISLDRLTRESSPELKPINLDPDQPVGIFYTSGTTGFPKGSLTTSRNILTTQKIAAAVLPAGGRDFGIMSLPLAHIMGFAVATIGVCTGIPGYFMRFFNPQRVLEAIEKFKATHFVGVPAMYAMLLQYEPEKYDLSSMKFWSSSADAMPLEHIQIFRKFGSFLRLGPFRTRAVFAEAYGMVELNGTCALKIAFPGINYPRGAVGFPVRPTKIMIVDENGKGVPKGEVGELAVKGPGVTPGYWNNPEATRECLTPEGFFRTGDMARRGRFGMLYFVDRKKDVIKSGGYSIFSVEVEEEILRNPKVAEVAVIGVPHPTKKEMPIAIVSLKPDAEATPEELIAWGKEHLAAYRAPREIKIIPAADMPYGMTLKVLKKDLKARYAPEYEKRSPEDWKKKGS